eukprot:TRINITY_DN3421_c0_g1_i1.p1 TRINITY_DN3421_c0_g1~~TRINITY_DN3421_c0_g1_i1.p1  ORF type:complete len:105 (-),score=5.77 TRINITY_DN3421_c0_g1_i1:24-317(-)
MSRTGPGGIARNGTMYTTDQGQTGMVWLPRLAASTHHSNLVKPNEEACVDYHGPAYQLWGQLCSTNPTGQDAMLVNPLVGHKYWITATGKRTWDIGA